MASRAIAFALAALFLASAVLAECPLTDRDIKNVYFYDVYQRCKDYPWNYPPYKCKSCICAMKDKLWPILQKKYNDHSKKKHWEIEKVIDECAWVLSKKFYNYDRKMDGNYIHKLKKCKKVYC